MEDLFRMDMTLPQINAISNLGLAHIGDGVYELLCRSHLCAQGYKTVDELHRRTVALVKAPTQARLAENCRFTIPFSRQELADYLSVDRSALSKELSRMKEAVLKSQPEFPAVNGGRI